jgi:TRAP-type C4-dicarboxylate transport system substrate-binding protein
MWLTWNVALWLRLVLLLANRRRFERLSSAERVVLEEAAREAVAKAASKPTSFQQKYLPAAVKVVKADEYELELVRDRLQPIYAELCSTSDGDRTLKEIERYLVTR